jgi:hypothetical protein
LWGDNIDEDELVTLREIGSTWLEAKTEQLESSIKEGLLKEIIDDNKNREN